MSGNNNELKEFVDSWNDDAAGMKKAFIELMTFLQTLNGVKIEFHPRPGLTYSMRGAHEELTEKPLFVMVDVIDGDPRWLSVCFYSDMITDEEELGDYVPEGLLGEDGTCFDFEEFNPDSLNYIKARIGEAFKSFTKS